MKIFAGWSDRRAVADRSHEPAGSGNVEVQGVSTSHHAPHELVGLSERLRERAMGAVLHVHRAPERLLMRSSLVQRHFPVFRARRLAENRAHDLLRDLPKGAYGQRKALDSAFEWFERPANRTFNPYRIGDYQEQVVVLVQFVKRIDEFANPASVYERVRKAGADLTHLLRESTSEADPLLIGYLYGLQRSLQERHTALFDDERERLAVFDVVKELEGKIKQLPESKKAETYECLIRNGWRPE